MIVKEPPLINTENELFLNESSPDTFIEEYYQPHFLSILCCIYTQFIILDCIYEKHMFKLKRKKKTAIFTQDYFTENSVSLVLS